MKVITVGRSQNNDIVIDDPYVSKTHCQIVKDDNGRVSIIDINSRNGVYINGVKAHGKVYLKTTDIVRIGNTTLPWRQYFNESFTPSTPFTPSAPPVQIETPSAPRNLDTKPSIIGYIALALSIIGAIVLLAAIIKLIQWGFLSFRAPWLISTSVVINILAYILAHVADFKDTVISDAGANYDGNSAADIAENIAGTCIGLVIAYYGAVWLINVFH